MNKKMTAMAVALLAAVGVQAGILFQDDFSGASTNVLNGTTPDITQGGVTWDASAIFKADGSIVDAANRGAWLTYAFEAGKVYTLSADIISSAASDWIALGFAQNANQGGRHTEASVQGRAWLLTSEAGQQVFAGPRATGKIYDNEIITDTTSAFSTYTLTLDTSVASNVLLSVNMGGSNVVSEASLGAFTNLNLGAFGFSTDAGSAGAIDNLLLSESSQSVTPALLTISSGTGEVLVNATNMNDIATYTLQGIESLSASNWTDHASTTGVSSVEWTVPATNDALFMRVVGE